METVYQLRKDLGGAEALVAQRMKMMAVAWFSLIELQVEVIVQCAKS